MKDYLLTFELDDDSEQIFVHGDAAGLEYLASQLMKLASRAKAGECLHDHYSTEEWGGQELSSERQSAQGKLINHVKVYGWPTIKRTKAHEKT